MAAYGRGLRLTGVAALLAVGVAAGVAAEQAIVGRRFRYDPDKHEQFGSLHGAAISVISDDEVVLHVEVDDALPSAPSDGLTMIFCHGYALNQNCWHYQRRDLRSLGRLVFADQRAHGRSARGRPSLSTIDQLGLDLGAIVDAIGGDGPLVLVGHSMGGMTVMALAAQRPELFTDGRVAGVALLGTTAGGLSQEAFGLPKPVARYLHKAAPRALERAIRRSDVLEAGRTRGNDLGFLLTKRYSFGSKVAPSLTNFTAEMINGTPVDVLAEFLPGLDAHEKREALVAMSQVEALVMVGGNDLLTPMPHAEEIIRRMPHAESVVLPDTGHMLMLERYPEVNYHLRELVARVRRNVAAGQP